MQFNVVLPDGSRFGPATMDMLNQWIAEGRLLPGTTLENTRTGELMLAKDLGGLMWNPPPPSAPQAPYVPPGYTTTQPYGARQSPAPYSASPVPVQTTGGNPDTLATWSFLLSIAGIICGCCFPLALIALTLGYTARSRGSLQGGAAVAFAWLVLLVSAGYWLMQAFGLVHLF